MTLETLVSIAPPPGEPHEVGSNEGWLEVNRALGTDLPADYKKFIELYGTGVLGGFLWIYNPFSKDHNQNLLVRIPEDLNIWRSMRAKYGESECPYPLYPEPNGILPWGHIDTGSELFWQTNGEPDEWTVVVNEARGPEFEGFNQSMSGFLASLLMGDISSDVLPTRLLRRRKQVPFVPYVETEQDR
jgi:hypothetical protein